MQGAHTVFGVTVSVYDEKLYPRELAQGKAMADAAVDAGAQYFIFSSLNHPGTESNGKLANTAHFDVKADIEKYIVSTPSDLRYSSCKRTKSTRSLITRHGPRSRRCL